MRIEVQCPGCGRTYLRIRKHVAAIARRAGRWTCQSCVTSARNISKAKDLGATRLSPKGYVVVKSAAGWMFEHRHIMETILGRRLREDEAVHHKNGDKADNRIENLEVILHGEHTKAHHVGAKRTAQALRNIRNAIVRKSTTRLTPALAASIRLRAAAGEKQKRIARDLRVSPMTVSRVVRRQAWDPAKFNINHEGAPTE